MNNIINILPQTSIGYPLYCVASIDNMVGVFQHYVKFFNHKLKTVIIDFDNGSFSITNFLDGRQRYIYISAKPRKWLIWKITISNINCLSFHSNDYLAFDALYLNSIFCLICNIFVLYVCVCINLYISILWKFTTCKICSYILIFV